jgi:hypothetical protein
MGEKIVIDKAWPIEAIELLVRRHPAFPSGSQSAAFHTGELAALRDMAHALNVPIRQNKLHPRAGNPSPSWRRHSGTELFATRMLFLPGETSAEYIDWLSFMDDIKSGIEVEI